MEAECTACYNGTPLYMAATGADGGTAVPCLVTAGKDANAVDNAGDAGDTALVVASSMLMTGVVSSPLCHDADENIANDPMIPPSRWPE